MSCSLVTFDSEAFKVLYNGRYPGLSQSTDQYENLLFYDRLPLNSQSHTGKTQCTLRSVKAAQLSESPQILHYLLRAYF